MNRQQTMATLNPKHPGIFAWLAVATGLLLLLPWVAMQFTAEVHWTGLDFAVMGGLLFGMGSLFVLLARRLPRRHWLVLGLVVALLFAYVWAELAVGLFTQLGS